MQYFNAYSYNYRVRFSHQHTRTFRAIKRPGTGRRDEQGCLGQKHNQSNIIPVTCVLEIMKAIWCNQILFG